MKAEAEIEKIEAIFSLPDYYEKYAAQTKELNQKLEDTKELIKSLFIRWDDLEKIKKGD